jgi:hypothetical protein
MTPRDILAEGLPWAKLGCAGLVPNGLLGRLLLGCSDLPGKPSSSLIFFSVFISCFPFLFCILF